MTDLSSGDAAGHSPVSNTSPADGPGGGEPSAARPARRAARDLAAASPKIRGGFLGLGLLAALWGLSALTSGPIFLFVGSLLVLLGFGLAGWLIARLVRAGANALDAWAERVETAETSERLIISALGRVAEALERSATVSPAREAARIEPATEIGKAIREAQWEHAEALIREYLETHPGAPEGARLARELETARGEEAHGLQAKIAAAREVGDPDRVLELRDSLRPLLNDDDLHALDLELTRWLMGLIQKRLRGGTIRVDVVELAAKVADRFDHIAEGASLRAALPTLRRSAGLCARCGKPYTGIADACPACLTTPSSPTFGTEFDPGSAEDDDLDRLPQPDEPV